MTDLWLPRLRDLRAPLTDAVAFGQQAIGYDPASPAASYGRLMKELFLYPEEQQREIETLCENKFPAFGYAALATVLEHTQAQGTFNVILTTNFDDLVADALYLYTTVRPLVIHHESLADYIRPTRTRPLIVKVHGDNHLSRRNTPEETAALPAETAAQVSSLLHDRGLIIMGYSGNDQSIVSLLSALPPRALPLGIYWCSATPPSCALSTWLQQRQAVWVESADFDELLLLVHAAMSLKVPSIKRFEPVFTKLTEDYKRLTGGISQQPATTAEAKALQAAVKKTDKTFTDWGAVEVAASRLVKTDPAEAEKIYLSGLEHFPKSAELLNNYALFLQNQQRPQEAEPYYQRALDVDPTRANTLGNYANFLHHQQRPQEAAAYYQRALNADPTHANTLGNYAVFLQSQQRPEEAAAYYQRTLAADPTHAITLGNYAQLLLARDPAEGLPMLDRAQAQAADASSALKVELAFYEFAHRPPLGSPAALAQLKHLLAQGARSKGWNFSANVARAGQDGHPFADWLPKLAAVAADAAPLETLADWPAWQQAGGEH